MPSPDLSALVTPQTRVRLTYSLVWPFFTDPQSLVDDVNAALQGAAYLILYGPATTPAAGPDVNLGLEHSGATTADVLTTTVVPTMTWDQWLRPLRAIPDSDFHPEGSATLTDQQLLSVGGVTPAQTAAQRTGAAQQAAPAASQSSLLGQLGAALQTVSTKAIIIGVVVIILVLLWLFGGQLSALASGLSRPKKAAPA